MPPPAPQDSSPVDVPVPTAASASVEAVCRAVTQALPANLGVGVDRRPVTGDPDRTAAWGDPAVTLTCGTAPPGQGGVDGTEFSLGLPDYDGSCAVATPDPTHCLAFLQRDNGNGNLFTTYKRAVTVAVNAPDAYDTQVLIRMLSALVLLPSAGR